MSVSREPDAAIFLLLASLLPQLDGDTYALRVDVVPLEHAHLIVGVAGISEAEIAVEGQVKAYAS